MLLLLSFAFVEKSTYDPPFPPPPFPQPRILASLLMPHSLAFCTVSPMFARQQTGLAAAAANLLFRAVAKLKEQHSSESLNSLVVLNIRHPSTLF